MSSLLMRRANRLAFPGGKPGFDPSHPAAQGSLGSFIASNQSYINLGPALSGPIISGTLPVYSPWGPLGPVNLHTVSGGRTQFLDAAGNNFPTSTRYFIACLFYLNSSGAGNTVGGFAGNDSVNQGYTFGFGTGHLFIGAGFDTNISAIANVPYFGVASLNGSTLNYVLRRLDTGTIQSVSMAMSGTELAAGALTLGDINGFPTNGGIAAIAVGHSFLTMPQLLQWADDPWAFWYPGKFDMMSAIKAAAAAASAAAFRKTLSYVGTRIGSRQNQVS